MYNSLFCFLRPYKYLKSLFAAREDMLDVKGYCFLIMYGVVKIYCRDIEKITCPVLYCFYVLVGGAT